jgi:hypothetical protein
MRLAKITFSLSRRVSPNSRIFSVMRARTLGLAEAGLGVVVAPWRKSSIEASPVLADRRVDRDVASGQALLHLDDLGALHRQPLGDEIVVGTEALALETVLPRAAG